MHIVIISWYNFVSEFNLVWSFHNFQRRRIQTEVRSRMGHATRLINVLFALWLKWWYKIINQCLLDCLSTWQPRSCPVIVTYLLNELGVNEWTKNKLCRKWICSIFEWWLSLWGRGNFRMISGELRRKYQPRMNTPGN